MKNNFLNKKKTTAIFAVLALIAGFVFFGKNLTGNLILNNQYSFNWISLIALSLIGCAIILGAYSIKKE